MLVAKKSLRKGIELPLLKLLNEENKMSPLTMQIEMLTIN
jgi:hypothetical protein